MQNNVRFTAKQRDLLTALGILCVLVVFGVVYMYFVIWAPEMKTLNSVVATAIDENRTVLLEIRAAEEKLNDRDEIKRKADYISKLAKMLPSTIDAPGFLNNLASALQATKIDYKKLKPETPEVKTGYTELPYSIECDGRYHDFGQFLNLIENNPNRFLRVKKFEIAVSEKRPSIHPITLSIATFFLTDSNSKDEKVAAK